MLVLLKNTENCECISSETDLQVPLFALSSGNLCLHPVIWHCSCRTRNAMYFSKTGLPAFTGLQGKEFSSQKILLSSQQIYMCLCTPFLTHVNSHPVLVAVSPFEHTLFFLLSLAPANFGCHVLLLVWKETTNIIPKRSPLSNEWLRDLYGVSRPSFLLVEASWLYH